MRTIKPALEKIMLLNALKTLFFILVMAVIILLMHAFFGLEALITLFFGEGSVFLASTNLLTVILSLIILTFVMVMFFTYLSIANQRYEFSNNGLFFSKKSVFGKRTDNISYRNISGVTYDESDFFSRMLDVGTVKLDLSSMGERELKIRYLENPSEIAKFISSVLRAYKFKQQAEYDERHRVKKAT